MNSPSRYRSRAIENNVIGFSIGYHREALLSRGLGLEHLREMLLRLARSILRQGASLAYGGHWRDTEDNFTYELLRLITAEQEDNSFGGPDAKTIGRLYNHQCWPYYLDVTPQLEAQWISCSRVVRITQCDAGFLPAEIVPDALASDSSPRTEFNKAVCLSFMRRRMLDSISIDVPDGSQEWIPPVVARIALGGKPQNYSGFMPGIFEEALTTLQKSKPLFLLGGFGGATEILAQAILNPGGGRPPELTVDWHQQHSKGFSTLLSSSFRLPPTVPPAAAALDELWILVQKAQADLTTLQTGLEPPDIRDLLTTRDMNVAMRLVRSGLTIQRKLPPLPA